MKGTFCAVDWGTTNRRAYVIDEGRVIRAERTPDGILAPPPGPFRPRVTALRDRLGGHPLVLAGMIGSRRGWVDAGYVESPVTLDTLAEATINAASDIWIVPGASCTQGRRGDVMRGEEILVLGAVHAGLIPPDATICQPGTHCKWVRTKAGAINDFTTAMTGELFALLRSHSLIGDMMGRHVVAGDAFAEGVCRSAEGDLLSALFGVRASSLLGLRDDNDASSYVSGLLIGTDVRAQVRPGAEVHVLSDPELGALYSYAIAQTGAHPAAIDGERCFVEGMARLWELLR